MIESVEDAYQAIAKILANKASPGWKLLRAVCPILNKGCGGIVTVQTSVNGGADVPIGWDVFALQDACLFLRADLLRATGQRIWGLTFTLHADGKFNIEYDYNKPAGYEETDETMDLPKGLEDLQTQGVHASKK
ncbi:hypothetical protein H6CHR_05011 [Variovorax sp. PBL-H6]|uniref:hypothetical protein n=1 Tax=Variovorax sp. PBL-H6 TaxID=434009 RepID=UPI00131759B3|nr:hypothetical protein [Variovorax sp. PBL-H6]VTU37614.1 hypothetical protein H6CHR_05011 [Variovorax sp. PBL-H6]